MRAKLSGVRVLLADDDADNAEMLAETLKFHGANVRTAANAFETLELLASWTPDALLLDVGMPDVDGYSLVRELRRAPALATVHILAVTAHTTAADRERAFAAGFDGHVAKPINGEALVALIAKLANKSSRLEDSGAYIIP